MPSCRVRKGLVKCFSSNYQSRTDSLSSGVGSGSYYAQHSEVILGNIVDGVEMIEWDARTLAIQ